MALAESVDPRRTASKPQKRGDQRRRAILTALEELLETTPLEEITTEQISTKAEVVRSAFYFYFPTKHAAVATLLRDRFTGLKEWAWPLLTSDESPAERWRAVLAWIVDEWREQPRMHLAMLDARSADPTAREVWEQWLSLYSDDLTRFIEFERANRKAPPGPPADRLAIALNGLNERNIESHLRNGGTAAEARELVDVLTHIWVSSIYGPIQEES